MAVRTIRDWNVDASSVIAHAQRANETARRQMEKSRKAHGETVSENLAQYTELHSALELKVQTSHRLTDKLQRRVDSLTTAIQLTKNSLADVDKAAQAKDAPLKVCTWRMEQREVRPLREQVRDVISPALESEHALLLGTQRKLASASRTTSMTILTLQHKLEEVKADLELKTQALSVDERCLRTTSKGFQNTLSVSRPSTTPRLSSANKTSAGLMIMQETSKTEMMRQQEVVKLDQGAASQEEAAAKVREENARLIQNCDYAVKEAAMKSERAMREGIAQNQHIRKRLEGELAELEAKIEKTRSIIASTQGQLASLTEPLELTSTCASWRTKRPGKENMNDPVSTKIQEHQASLLKSREALSRHQVAEKAALKQLEEQMQKVKEDLRDKTASLHIALSLLSQVASKTGQSTLETPRRSEANRLRRPQSAGRAASRVPFSAR